MPSKKESYFTLVGKRRKRTGTVLVVVLLAVAAFAVYSYYSYTILPGGTLQQGIGALGSAHIHQKAAIYINGTRLNLALPQYQSQDSYAHFEDGDGVTLHLHATGISVEYVLSKLKLLDKGPFGVWVNGQPNSGGVKYQPRNGEAILITNTPELSDQELKFLEADSQWSAWTPPGGSG